MRKNKQQIYEVLCLIGLLILILSGVKANALLVCAIISSIFLAMYLIPNTTVKKITFAIVLGLVSYGGWTCLITMYLTNFIFWIKPYEHSLWDLFAIVLPALFALLTLVWALWKRELKPKYDSSYIVTVFISFAIVWALSY